MINWTDFQGNHFIATDADQVATVNGTRVWVRFDADLRKWWIAADDNSVKFAFFLTRDAAKAAVVAAVAVAA